MNSISNLDVELEKQPSLSGNQGLRETNTKEYNIFVPKKSGRDVTEGTNYSMRSSQCASLEVSDINLQIFLIPNIRWI